MTRRHPIGIAVFASLLLSLSLLLMPPTAIADEPPVEQPDPIEQADNFGPPAPEQPEAEMHLGGLPDPFPAESIHDANETRTWQPQGASLPARYDSRDRGFVTLARNQSPFGTCWAFATIAAIESSLLAHGQVSNAQTLDLSERQLAYFTYNLEPDPLGNTAGDQNIGTSNSFGSFGREVYLGNGGNAYIASNVAASGIGIANENALPTYSALVSDWNEYRNDANAFHDATALDPGLARGVNSWRLTQRREIPMSDKNDVKLAIQQHGGVAASMEFTPESFLHFGTGGYYCRYDYATNHLIEIVGWDDNYSRDNFSDYMGRKPSKNGAWLIKNSEVAYIYNGNEYVPTNYLWVSYEDVPLNSSTAYSFEVEASSAISNTYQYDGTAGWCSNYIRSGGSIANVFKAKANAGGNEKLEAVSFSLTSTNVDYSIQVYGDLQDSANPLSGTPLLSRPITGKTSYSGYYTVKLSQTVTIPENTLFSVVITLSHQDGSDVMYAVDTTFGSMGRYSGKTNWIHFINNVEPGQSFERDYASASWDDLSSTSFDVDDEPASCARIKVFTNNSGKINLANAVVAPVADYAYTGLPIKPEPTVTYNGMTLKLDRDYRLSYNSNTQIGTATITITGIGNYSGSKRVNFNIVEAPTVQLVPIYRMYNTRTSEHLWTTSVAEYGASGKGAYADWRQEGVAWYAPKTSEKPVHRLYNPGLGDHHYSASPGEIAMLTANHGWRDEGIAFYSAAKGDVGSIEIYRVYNNRLKRGQHHYTTSPGERKSLTTLHGWRDEGVSFYGYAKAA